MLSSFQCQYILRQSVSVLTIIIKNSVKYESISDVVPCSAGYTERKFNYKARRHK